LLCNDDLLKYCAVRPERYVILRKVERGWLELHDSGTFVRFTQCGAGFFA
jgi:hypothetical protein